jgi:hypothetical protein
MAGSWWKGTGSKTDNNRKKESGVRPALFFCLETEPFLENAVLSNPVHRGENQDGTRDKYVDHNGRAANTPRNAHFRSMGTCAVMHKHPTPGGFDSREENCIGTVARFYSDPCGIVCAGRDSRRATRTGI